ncbi:MAG: type II toxin-antitoxin system VapC family toxin [Acidobacteria bacterium]|nr:type II toxin-antitoxin system VapC family toxin [Acidobacteriota bacterium]
MNQSNSPGIVVVDASVIVSIVSKETSTHVATEEILNRYTIDGAEFFAPNVVISEVLFALCQKAANGILSEAGHQKAVNAFQDILAGISLANDEAGLISRAIEIRASYGCSRSSDSLYIALAERLAGNNSVEIFTLDAGMTNQAAKNAPSVVVRSI